MSRAEPCVLSASGWASQNSCVAEGTSLGSGLGPAVRASAQPSPHPAPAGGCYWCLPWPPLHLDRAASSSARHAGVVRQLLPKTFPGGPRPIPLEGFALCHPKLAWPLIQFCPEDGNLMSPPKGHPAAPSASVHCGDMFCRESCMSAASRATASLPPKELLAHHAQPGASAPHLSVVGSPQQYETTSISSVFAKHLPTDQSLLRLQGEASHCLFNLTTKFCQSHHPAVNNEGNLQPLS